MSRGWHSPSSRCLALCLCLAGAGQVPAAEAPADTGASLQTFLSAALEHNPQLGIAAATLEIQKARKDAAFGQLLPQLSASASVTANRQEVADRTDEFRGERYALQLSQVLFNWEAFAARKRAALIAAQQEAEYQYERSQLLIQVADRYLGVLQAQDALASVQAEREAVGLQVTQLQSLYDRQLVRITDLRQAQASLSAVRAEQAKQQNELEAAREALRVLSGLAIGELGALRADAPLPPLEQELEDWARLARSNNQQVRAGRAALAAAGQSLAQARGALLPKLSLVAQRQNSDIGYDNAPIRRTSSSYVGVSGSMGLYTGGSRMAAIKEARSTRALGEHQLRQQELEAEARVRRAYLEVRSGESLIAAATDMAEATRLSAEAAQREFSLGVATSVEVLKAIRERFKAERDLQAARYGEIRSFLVLKHESGTLTQADMDTVGSWFVATEP